MTGFGELLVVMLIILIIIVAAVFTVYILFLINLRDLLREISEPNRKIKPGNVFLILIPLFGLVYSFIMFPKISDSIKLEYEIRGRVMPGDGLRSLGLVFAILMLLSVITNNFLADYSGIFSLGLIVILIIYWVKSAQIKNDLKGSNTIGHRTDLLD